MKELKEAVCFGVSLLEAVFDSLEDGKFDFTDLIKLWDPISRLGDAVEGSSKILGEIMAMDEAAKRSLMDEVKKDFDIADDVLEARIEGAIQLILGIAMYGATYFKKKKG